MTDRDPYIAAAFEPKRPDTFADLLNEVASYLDLFDGLLGQNEVKVNGRTLRTSGDLMQRDLRRLANSLPAEVDARLIGFVRTNDAGLLRSDVDSTYEIENLRRMARAVRNLIDQVPDGRGTWCAWVAMDLDRRADALKADEQRERLSAFEADGGAT